MIPGGLLPHNYPTPEGNYDAHTVDVPALLGLSEVAECVGTRRQQAYRWSKAEHVSFPQPALQMPGGPVWFEEDIVAWHEWRSDPSHDPEKPPGYRSASESLQGKLIGINEIGIGLLTRKQQGYRWSCRPDFPPCAIALKMGRLFWTDDVARWWADRYLSSKYPWPSWFDGTSRTLVKEQDFSCLTSSMASTIRNRVRQVGGSVELTFDRTNDSITFRVTDPGLNA